MGHRFSKRTRRRSYGGTRSSSTPPPAIIKVSEDGGQTFRTYGKYTDTRAAVEIAEDLKKCGYTVILDI